MSESHGSVSLLLPEHGCPPNSGVGLVQLRVLVLFLTVIPPSQDTVQELQGFQGAQLPSTNMKIDGKMKTWHCHKNIYSIPYLFCNRVVG